MAKKKEYWFDKAAAKHAVDFIEECCTHVKGELTGKSFKLAPWQKTDIVEPIFGWKRADGTRKYREAWIEIPRKNGKTPLAVAIQLYMFFCDGEPGAEIYFAASSKAQANIAFEIATQMIKQNKTLTRNADVFKKSIVLKDTTTFFRAVSGDSYDQDGYNTHALLIDEVHAQKDRKLIDVLTTSTAARRQPLTIYITTAGIAKKGNIAYDMHLKAQKIKKGLIKDDAFLSVIYQAGSEDDPFKETTWKKANPNYGISLKKDYMLKQVEKVQEEPGYLYTFLRLHLNVWTSSERTFIADKIWNKCNLEPIPEEFFYGKDCQIAFDLSSTKDFTAMAIGTKDEYGVHHIKVYTYIPEKATQIRSMREQILVWEKQGWVQIVPGDWMDNNVVYNKIQELKTRCTLREVAYDRWNKGELAKKLEEDGAVLFDFGQGFKSMSPATKLFEKMIGEKRINHGGNPVLAWMNSSVAITMDAVENIKPNKQKSTDKIDGIVSMIMCNARLIEAPAAAGPSVYEERGLLSV